MTKAIDKRHLRHHTVLILCLLVVGFIMTAMNTEAAARKYVFVGDSYTTARATVKNPWPFLFAENMGVPKSKCRNVAKGAFGFGKPNHKFVQEIKGLKKDSTVTDVIVFGGIANDRNVSYWNIAKSMDEFNTVCRQKFPKARIVYGLCNWNIANTDTQEKIITRIPLYYYNAIDLGWIYLDGIEEILRDKPELFYSDNHHPIPAGHRLIADAVTEAYQKRCVSGIKLSRAGLRTHVGATKYVTAQVYPETAQNQEITWRSTDPSVVTVDNGKLTAVGVGEALIWARSVDGNYGAHMKVYVPH